MRCGQHVFDHLIVIRIVILSEIQVFNLGYFLLKGHSKIKKGSWKILIVMNCPVVELRWLVPVEGMAYEVEEDDHADYVRPHVDSLIV